MIIDRSQRGVRLSDACLRQAETELPAPAPFPIQARPSAAPEVRFGSILLADDEQVFLECVAEVLENLGYPVVTATDGYEALERFRENADQIRLVILDAKMPGMGGIESLQAMLALRPGLKALLCTGYVEASGLTTAKEHGFTGFLGKPFKVEELKNALQNAMQ